MQRKVGDSPQCQPLLPRWEDEAETAATGKAGKPGYNRLADLATG
jgi:hypothetical protein